MPETAARLAADSLTSGPVGEINPDRYRISRWVPLIVATGEFELAGTQLDRLAELLDGVPVEAQFSGNFHAATAELALWEGRPADALDEIERGLERIGDQDGRGSTPACTGSGRGPPPTSPSRRGRDGTGRPSTRRCGGARRCGRPDTRSSPGCSSTSTAARRP